MIKKAVPILMACLLVLPQLGCATDDKARGIQQKVGLVKSGFQKIQQAGGDPRPIAAQMQQVKRMLDGKDIDGANAKLDDILVQIDTMLENSGPAPANVDKPVVSPGSEALYENIVKLDASNLNLIRLPGYGNEGIFDPSITYDPQTGKVWMTFSSVNTDRQNDKINIATGLAYSGDKGKTWQGYGTINESVDITIPANTGPNKDRKSIAANWRNEVSAITYDPGAPASERWKVVWHHYLGIGKKRYFQHSWIALKTAATPEGPWSSERKLFIGKGYQSFQDDFASAPEVAIHELDRAVNHCVGFSEPGLMATADALYMSLQCGVAPNVGGKAKIFLLQFDHRSEKWRYLGDLVTEDDAKRYNFGEITGSELFMKNSTPYLIVTVTAQGRTMGIPHLGCMAIEIEELQTARLARGKDGSLNAKKYLTASDGTHGGLCTFVPEAIGSGVIYGLNTPGQDRWWELYTTGVSF